ncbi:hypothetical protein TCE0_039f13059 [Talaromyces pinophilus]|uniref:Uncharacterized protein n=1 Tax=Talaromyces pinophilus TaxID=128442 RepID=A0A6N4SLJ4_TALPI|nr:hypothetical protein TCE0_039f13059 [Talaromyces pinophilus]
MTRPLPHQLSQTLSQQWPCRETQIRQLAALLDPHIPSPSTIVLHGISATCKSTLISAVLDALPARHAIIRCVECITSRHLLQKILLETLHSFGMQDEWEKFGKGRCEHVSTLLILLGDIFAAARNNKKMEGEVGGDEFVLVLDGIDRQREASQMLLAALARLGEMIPSLTVVLIMNTTPRPLFLQSAGVAHINFPPYTRKEAITIVTAAGLPKVEWLSNDYNEKIASTTSLEGIYAQFVATVYDSLVGPTAGTIPSFRSICERLWPRFLQPMRDDQSAEGWDFTRLLLRNRAMFKIQGESMLVHHIVSIPEETNKEEHKTKKRKLGSLTTAPKLPSLPYFPTLVLTSAYVASHTPQRLDTIFFSKFSSSSLSARNKRSHHRRRLKLLSQAQADDDNDNGGTPKKGKRVKTKITKSMLNSAFATTSATTSAIPGDNAAGGGAGGGGATQLTGSSTLLTARPFTLERLIAIYHAIDPNPPANALHTLPTADAIYNELATLRRLRLVVPATGGSNNVGGGATAMMTADVGEKWAINVSGDWVGELAKGIGVEVGEWLAGGLD